jgi:hypothetical protein
MFLYLENRRSRHRRIVTKITRYHFLALMISGFALLLTRDAVFTESSDLGGHYAATEYIYNAWEWPPPEMGLPARNYPLLSHTFAAILGAILGSRLRAILMLSVLSTCAIYAVLGWGTRSRDLTGLTFSLLAGTLMILFAPSNTFWGNEVLSNFFYAQIVGEALFLSLLLLTSTLSRLVARLVALFGGTLLLNYVYTLSAVHLAFSAPFLWAIPLLQEWEKTKRFPWQRAVGCGVLLASLSLLVLSSSIFYSMTINASFNGGINVDIGNNGVLFLMFVNLLLAILLVMLTVYDKCTLANPNFVFAALAGVTMTAMVQWIALNLLGHGSNYAILKHVYGLGSMLVIGFSAVTVDIFRGNVKSGLLVSQLRAARQHQFRAARQYLAARQYIASVLAPSIFLAFALISLLCNRPWISLSSVERFEAEGRKLVASETLGKAVYGHTVSLNMQFSTGINFTIAKGALGLNGKNQNEQILIFLGPLKQDEQTADFFLISPGQAGGLEEGCEVKVPFELAVSRLVRASCYDQIKPYNRPAAAFQ